MISTDVVRLVSIVSAAAEERCAEERQALDDTLGPADGCRIVSVADIVRTFEGRAMPAAKRLREILEGLDVATIRRLVALMYAGRDGDSYRTVLRDPLIVRMEPAEGARTLYGKARLGEYLRRGAERAVRKSRVLA